MKYDEVVLAVVWNLLFAFMHMADYDLLLKFMVVGDAGVGKSSLLVRFADGTFVDNYLCTIGVDFRIRRMFLDGRHLKVNVWDLSGNPRFSLNALARAAYSGIKGVLVIFDMTDRETYNNVLHWIEEVRPRRDQEMCMILIGNKADLSHRRVVSYKEAASLAQRMDMKYLETSVKTQQNVELAFETLAQEVMRQYFPRRRDDVKQRESCFCLGGQAGGD
ncbi:unnamed protein product [Durusdinium trenchii]|uniref:Uncharacterized protein n=1 Tax=Durusdinium trenchii TaxID=1381693 RepID=A0ABP0QF41_9DINO